MSLNQNHSLRKDQVIPHSPTKGMVTEKTAEEAGYTEDSYSENTTNAYKDSQNTNNSKYK
ncbi:hypothetical protein [Anaerosporobacter sp.]